MVNFLCSNTVQFCRLKANFSCYLHFHRKRTQILCDRQHALFNRFFFLPYRQEQHEQFFPVICSRRLICAMSRKNVNLHFLTVFIVFGIENFAQFFQITSSHQKKYILRLERFQANLNKLFLRFWRCLCVLVQFR